MFERVPTRDRWDNFVGLRIVAAMPPEYRVRARTALALGAFVMIDLDPRSTALVLIDLQNGIVGRKLEPD